LELVDPRTGEAYEVPEADVPRAQQQFGFVSPQNWTLQKKYGSGEEQAKAAAKLAANVATFGMAGFDAAADNDAIGVFREKSPTLAALTEVAGSIAPAALGGGAASVAMRAAGFGARGAALGAMAAEEVAQSLSIERQQAAEEHRGIDAVNVIQGLPLAFGLSAASRIARGGRAALAPLEAGRALGAGAREFGSSLSAGYRGTAAEGIEAAAEEGANAVSRGRATSKARRSVGAAGTDGDKLAPLTEAEVKSYVDNFDDIHRETERMGGDAIDDALGGPAPTFDEVHNLRNKQADLEGKMADANWGHIASEVEKQHKAFNKAAAALEEKGAKQAARQLRAHAEEFMTAYKTGYQTAEPAEIFRTLDRGKQAGDRMLSKYGAMKDIQAADVTETVSAIVEPLRKRLESRKIWGKTAADYQRETNALWSGNDGLIRSGNQWQAEFLERSAAGKVRKGLQEVPTFQVRGDVVQHALSMSDREFTRTLAALDTWADKAQQMALTKAELGANTLGTTPVMRLQQSIEDMRTMGEELRRLREAKYRGADALARKAAEPVAKGTAEALFESTKQIPGIGQVVSTADAAAKKLTGKSLGERLYEPKIKPPQRELTRESAREAIKGRRGKPSYPAPGPRPVDPTPSPTTAAEPSAVPQPGPRRTGTRGSADVGAMAGAGALAVGGLAAAPAITDALADLSDDNRGIRERAATGLIVKATRPRPLPSSLERFKEGAPSLAAAYAVKLDDLQQALNDPRALVTGIADAYGSVADHHEDLYVELVQRTAAAAEYVLQNAPPSVGISVVNPDGVAPDTLALAQFAQTWSGAMNPGDVVYDVGTGSATPTQIKALREVHPDIYGALRNDVLKQVDRATMPFETLRQLDVLFDLPGISGPAFSPDMTKTMQAVWKQPANPSKGAAGAATAPQSANAQFAAGPTSML
jgi:hypothetical protein